MSTTLQELGGHRCVVADAEGPDIRDGEGARALIEDALGDRASVIVVPVGRLDGSFFQLRSGLAGEVLQKAANYGLRFAVVGDVSAYVAASEAFRDLVVESERGTSILFAPDLPELAKRLADVPPRER